MAQSDIRDIFEGEQNIRSSSMTNTFLCKLLVKRMKIEKVLRSSAYGILVTANAVGLRRRSVAANTPLLELTTEEDKIKILTVRKKGGGECIPCDIEIIID